MAKIKYRYREKILDHLSKSVAPLSLRKLLPLVAEEHEKNSPRLEKNVARELRFLVHDKELEKLPGSIYRIRPPKIKKEKEPEPEKENRQAAPKNKFHDRGRQKTRDERNSQPGKAKIGGENRGRDGERKFSSPSRSGGSFRDRFRESNHDNRSSESGGPKAYAGKVIKNTRGFAFVKLEKAPAGITEDVFLNPEEAENLLSGDRVEVVLDRNVSAKGPSGRVKKVLERGLQKAVAKYMIDEASFDPYAEIETKDMHVRVHLERDPAFRKLEPGAAILVEITPVNSTRPGGKTYYQGKLISVLADSMNSTTDDPYVITKHKLREFFPDDVVEASERVPAKLSDADIKEHGRVDIRHIPFVTIDGADARDFDDAVCAEALSNGDTRLWVAIADVAHYVTPGSPMDTEAYLRGTSIYFPHRVLPMLPERLSNGLCSLNPHEDRLALVCEMLYDAEGKRKEHKVYEAVFQSQHRCVYETLQAFYDKPAENAAVYKPAVASSLKALFKLYKKVHVQRFARGSIDLDLPEAKVIVGKDGEVQTIKKTERVDTHRLIEEFMIAANEAVSEIMQEAKLPFIFRVHESPDFEAIARFCDVAKSMAIDLPKLDFDDIDPHTYQKLVEAVRPSPTARVLNFLLLRSMKQAVYSHENLKHFGLASLAYTHFTSPIRRYPDLIVHRLLKAYIHKSKKEAEKAQGGIAENLEAAAVHCSQRERLAVDAERDIIRMKQVRYAEKHLGEIHMGIITGITAKGCYVELKDVFIEGFIHLDRLGTDMTYNEKTMSLRNKSSGLTIRMGDDIEVQIARTNPHLHQVDLEPITSGGGVKAGKKVDHKKV